MVPVSIQDNLGSFWFSLGHFDSFNSLVIAAVNFTSTKERACGYLKAHEIELLDPLPPYDIFHAKLIAY